MGRLDSATAALVGLTSAARIGELDRAAAVDAVTEARSRAAPTWPAALPPALGRRKLPGRSPRSAIPSRREAAGGPATPQPWPSPAAPPIPRPRSPSQPMLARRPPGGGLMRNTRGR